jgi:hypothetical protein
VEIRKLDLPDQVSGMFLCAKKHIKIEQHYQEEPVLQVRQKAMQLKTPLHLTR